MDGLQQWNAQHAIVHPKLKDLRERYVAAKKELIRLQAIPHPSPDETLVKLTASLLPWLDGLKARSLIAASFGAPLLDQYLTLEHIIVLASEDVLPMENEAINLKCVARTTFHYVDDMDMYQARSEKLIDVQVKEVLKEANRMTTLLRNASFRKGAKFIHEFGQALQHYDEELLKYPEGSDDWQYADDEKLRIVEAAHARLLMNGYIDSMEKKVTALMARLGVKIPRQKVLWEFEFQNMWKAMNALDKFAVSMVMEDDALWDTGKAGEKSKGKWC